MIHAGIDLHSNNMVIVAINDKDKVLREAKLPSSKRALDDFFNTFDEPVQAVVECTSFWQEAERLVPGPRYSPYLGAFEDGKSY